MTEAGTTHGRTVARRRGRALGIGAVMGIALASVALAAPPSGGGGGLPLPPSASPGDTDFGDGTDDDTGSTDAAGIDDQRYQEHLDRADRAFKQKRWRESITEYKAALDLRPGDPEALRRRARAYKERTAKGKCPNLAIEDLTALELYDPLGMWPAERGTAIEWMADCDDVGVYVAERLTLAMELAELAPDERGRPPEIRVQVAEWLRDRARASRGGQQGQQDLLRALRNLELYLKECAKDGREPVAEALELQGELYRGSGEPQRALDAYKALLARPGQTPERVARLRGLVAELELEITVADLQRVQGGKPKAEAEEAFGRGVAALRVGNLSIAAAELERATAISPLYPKAYYYLGEVHARSRRLQEAIEAYNKSIAMERYDYASHVALGLLYKKEFFRTEDEKALEHLGLALKLRPDLHVLRFHLGELEANRDKERAREHFRVFIENCAPDDPLLGQAREALRGLERETIDAQPFLPPIGPSDQALLDPELHRLLSEAYVLGAEQGEWDRAEKSLLRAREQFPDEPALLNMLALVVDAQERPGDARMYWEESLAVDAEQMEVHERLGIMLDNDEGLDHLRTAAELGSVIARFKLAKMLWDRFDLWEASEQLDLYLRETGENSIYWDSAQSLRTRMDDTFRRLYIALGVLVIVAVGVPSLVAYRRLRGASLAQLLERSPKSFPEVAHILSLIRHEILKHNTAFLADVGRALELDEPDAGARAALLSRRLFGDTKVSERVAGGQEPGAERRGIYGRYLGYVEELQKVGTAHGVTLNLARKDPIFREMLAAFREVADYAADLRRVGTLRSGKRLEIARVLARAADVLGRRAFERLSDLIRSLCVAEVDAGLLEEVFARVAAEDRFAGIEVAPLRVDGVGARVRIFRTDLEDILTNVLRNSLHSSSMYAPRPLEVAVTLASEVDEITGLTSLEIRVKDRSAERLTNEMLRGRYVERGMGITADLLSRYDGSIAVEPEPGWQKAVVIRFFALEEGTT